VLPECFVDEALDALTSRSGSFPEPTWRRQASIERTPNSRYDLVRCDTDFGDVHDRSLRTGDPNAPSHHHIGIGDRARRRVNYDAGLSDQPASSPRHREMHGVSDDVGEPKKREGRLVRDDGIGRLPQPGGDDLLIRLVRVVTEPVQAPSDAQEAPALGVVREQRRTETACLGLGGRKVARLRASLGEERVVVRIRRVVHNLDDT